MLELIVVGVVALVTGLVAGLHVIAPKTQSKKDDELLAFLEKYGEPVVKEVSKYLTTKR
jgi:hypothetical protein